MRLSLFANSNVLGQQPMKIGRPSSCACVNMLKCATRCADALPRCHPRLRRVFRLDAKPTSTQISAVISRCVTRRSNSIAGTANTTCGSSTASKRRRSRSHSVWLARVHRQLTVKQHDGDASATSQAGPDFHADQLYSATTGDISLVSSLTFNHLAPPIAAPR
jgi:hypothetical protein